MLKIFTIVGILEAALTYFVGYAGARLVWWVPHVEPPLVYEVWSVLIIALGGALSISDPVLAGARWDADSPRFDDEIGLWIAQRQAGVSDDAEEKEGEESKDDGQPESPRTIVRYTMPTGWRRIRTLPGAEAGHVMSLRIQPDKPMARLARAELGLQIRALPEHVTTHEDSLESWTRENLAVWGATPFRTARSSRHGFESYECEFFRPSGCGYLVWFIAFGYALIFTWTVSSADVYKRYLKAVDEFIDVCQISPPNASKKEST